MYCFNFTIFVFFICIKSKFLFSKYKTKKQEFKNKKMTEKLQSDLKFEVAGR